MEIKKLISLLLVLAMVLPMCACAPQNDATQGGENSVTVTDMVDRQVTVTPGSYKKVVCIGAGALRMKGRFDALNLLQV